MEDKKKSIRIGQKRTECIDTIVKRINAYFFCDNTGYISPVTYRGHIAYTNVCGLGDSPVWTFYSLESEGLYCKVVEGSPGFEFRSTTHRLLILILIFILITEWRYAAATPTRRSDASAFAILGFCYNLRLEINIKIRPQMNETRNTVGIVLKWKSHPGYPRV